MSSKHHLTKKQSQYLCVLIERYADAVTEWNMAPSEMLEKEYFKAKDEMINYIVGFTENK